MTESRRLSMSDEFKDVKLSEEDAADFFVARQIMQEIRSFGISQSTSLKLIELLALELESREKMLAIIAALKGHGVSPMGGSVLEK